MRIRHKPWAKPELEACDFCIAEPEQFKGKWQEEFTAKNPIRIELGCGKGGFISKAASAEQDKNFIAVDIKSEMLVLAKRKIEAEYEKQNLDFGNIRIFIKNIEQIDNIFSREDNIERIYINFCNPWPRNKHKKRRLTHYRQLVKYKSFLSGEIWFKTDDDQLFDESIEYFEQAGYDITYMTRDLHESEFEENIITEHEQMFAAEGKKIKFLIAKP